jgi:hypothetical protein
MLKGATRASRKATSIVQMNAPHGASQPVFFQQRRTNNASLPFLVLMIGQRLWLPRLMDHEGD